MRTVQELTEQWCRDHGVTAQSEPGRVAFSVDGANGSFPGAVLPLEEERAMVCLFGLGTYVPESARDEAARQLAALNFPLRLGAVFLNRDTGELSLRVTQLLPPEDEAAAALIDRLLPSAANAMDALLPALTRLCCL